MRDAGYAGLPGYAVLRPGGEVTPERLLRALVDACGPHSAHPARAGDAVAGRPARFVAAPATAAGVAAVLRVAADADLVVVARGGGTKLDWGSPPPRVDLLLDTARLNGVWHHRPDKLTAEVGAGTTVPALQAALALSGQRLAMDPPSSGATVGGVLAVNESGPLRHRFGPPVEQVRGRRQVSVAGSPADDDGSPAVLISATVALQPVPEVRRWVTVGVDTPLRVHNAIADTLDADVSPSAVEVDLPAGPDGQRPGVLATLIEGDPADVAQRAGRLAAALGGDLASAPPPWWGRYPFGPDAVALRLTVSAADLHSVVYALRDAAGGAVPVRGSAGVGTVHAVLPGASSPERVEQILDAVRGVLMGRGGRCVIVSAPPAVAARLDMAGPHDLF